MTMIRTCSILVATVALGATLSGCSKTTESTTATSSQAASSQAASSSASPSQATAAPGGDLMSLLPTPAGATAKGPDSIADNGIHVHYQVSGAPTEVMESFKKSLEGKGWDIATVVTSGGGYGGGATYTGTNGAAYGVFDGGGPSGTTYIDVCTWAAKPANPNCSRGDR